MTAIRRPGSTASAPRPPAAPPAEAEAAPSTAAAPRPGEATAAAPSRPIPPEARNRPGELMVMQYNVENLFDTRDDPGTADEDFTPERKERWTEEKLAHKLQNLGRVIRHVNGGRAPRCWPCRRSRTRRSSSACARAPCVAWATASRC